MLYVLKKRKTWEYFYPNIQVVKIEDRQYLYWGKRKQTIAREIACHLFRVFNIYYFDFKSDRYSIYFYLELCAHELAEYNLKCWLAQQW